MKALIPVEVIEQRILLIYSDEDVTNLKSQSATSGCDGNRSQFATSSNEAIAA